MPVTFENTALPDIIELKNISQIYYDQKTKKEHVVIKDLNLLIEDKPGQGQFVCILGRSGCGKCVSGNTWVRTKEGIRLISDIVSHRTEGLQPAKNFYVKNSNRDEVVSHFYYGGFKDTLIVKTKEGEIEGTLEHPVLTWSSDLKLVWKKMKDLSIGDILIKDDLFQSSFIPNSTRIHMPIYENKQIKLHHRLKELCKSGMSQIDASKKLKSSPMVVSNSVRNKYVNKDQIKQPCYLSKDIAYYLGLMAGDGCIKGKNTSFTSMDKELIDFYIEFNKNILGLDTRVYGRKNTKAFSLRPHRLGEYTNWIQKVFGGDSFDSHTAHLLLQCGVILLHS